tara:strand:+ start:301 stop:624 length:324 start_codon:yes stop_codon:yes gene_type:complete
MTRTRPKNSKELWAGLPALAQTIGNLKDKGLSHQEVDELTKEIADVLQSASGGYFSRDRFETHVARVYMTTPFIPEICAERINDLVSTMRREWTLAQQTKEATNEQL